MNASEQLQEAEALMAQGNMQEARKLYDELCRMEHLTAVERGAALFGLGACFFVHESYAPAASRLKESWELLAATSGMDDALTTRSMVLLSRTLIALGDLESGMDIGRAALRNLVRLHGQEAEQTATAAFFLSSGAYRCGRLAEAEELTLLAKRAWEKIHGEKSLQVTTCLDALAKLREICGELRQAAQLLRQSLRIKMALLGQEHEISAAALGQSGMLEARQGNWQEARQLLGRSLEIFSDLGLPENAPTTAAFREMLATCRNMLDRESDHEPE